MNRLPNPTQPTATQVGQPTPDTDHQADQLWNAYDRAILEGRPYNIPTSYKDCTPVPAYGLNPSVPQPGRAPMSQSAVDYSARMLSTGVASVLFSASASGILIASGHANPTVVGIIIAAPAFIAVPVLALSRLVKRAKEVAETAPPVIHQHYTGTVHVDARTVNSTNRGVWASTRNHPPSAGE